MASRQFGEGGAGEETNTQLCLRWRPRKPGQKGHRSAEMWTRLTQGMNPVSQRHPPKTPKSVMLPAEDGRVTCGSPKSWSTKELSKNLEDDYPWAISDEKEAGFPKSCFRLTAETPTARHLLDAKLA